MTIQVLGPVCVVVDGESDTLGPRLTRLLAVLTIELGSVVSDDRLVDIVWDGDPPRSAEATLKTYITRLRRALGDPDAIVRRQPGYLLVIDADAIDAARFDAEIDRANEALRAGDHHRAQRALETALDRWNGRPFGGLGDEEWATAEAERLGERHLEARELAVEVSLSCGRTAEAIASARKLVGEAPLRERPRELLMRSLYAAGRHAEALREYQAFSASLADETGLDPSPELAHLERRMLTQELPAEAGRRWLRGYELGERLGEGSFAVVHRATQPGIGREVAVKIIRPELANRPDFVRRFEREARVVAEVEHPNVVPLYDFWREPDAAYLVMRYLRGGSVEGALRTGGPFSTERVTRLLAQVGGALSAAHRAGLVHRDVRPANLLLDDEGVVYLADFGIATEIAVADELPILEPAYAAPEVLRGDEVGATADVLSLAVTIYELLTGRLPFADSVDRAELIRRQLAESLPPVGATRRDLPASIDDVLGRATAKSAEDRYASVDDFVRDARRALTGEGVGVALPARPTRNPYLGLRAFSDVDAGRFHGRDALVAELVEAVAAHRWVTVVGPSGCGKSSVVNAGLLPALRSDAVRGSSGWFVTAMAPGDDPLAALEAALARVAVDAPSSLRAQLGERGGVLRAIRRSLPGERLLVVIDQFEELFTRAGAEQRDHLLAELATAVAADDIEVRIVASLRADHFDGPLAHRSVAGLVTDGAVAVRPMDPVELERAIVAPAGSVGVTVEPSLAAELVATVSAEPTALPLLQFVLRELFDRRVSDVMSMSSYVAMGGLAGSLAATADRLVDADGTGGDEVARRLFGRLVAVGGGEGDDRRRRATIGELDDGDRTTTLIETFAAARLFTIDRDAMTREPTVEVAHEAFLAAWPRLRAWLNEDRSDLAIVQSLSAPADAWNREDRDAGGLARGARLAIATDLAGRRPDLLNATEKEWVDASRRAADNEERAREQRAERDRRQNRALRRLAGSAAALLVAALVATAVALVARSRAVDSEREAALARSVAETNAEAAVAARDDAEVERLIALSAAQLDVDPELAMLLALEAHRRRSGPATLGAVHRSLASDARRVSFSPAATVMADGELTLSADGRTALEWRRGPGTTEVRFRDLDSGDVRGSTIELEAINAAAVSGDGSVAGLIDLGGTLWVVDTDGVVLTHRPDLVGDPEQWSLALSERGDVAAIVGAPSGVELVEVSGDEARVTGSYDGAEHGAPLFDVAVSGDGVLTAVGYRFGDPGAPQPELDIEVLDSSGAVVRSIGDRGSPVHSLALTDDGTVFSGHRDGTLRVSADGREPTIVAAHTSTVEAVRVHRNWVVTASTTGEVRWWTRGGESLGAPAQLPDSVADLSVTSDGRTMVAVAGGRRTTFDPSEPLFEVERRPVDGSFVFPDGPPMVIGVETAERVVTVTDLASGDLDFTADLSDVYPPDAMAPFVFPSADGTELVILGEGPRRAVVASDGSGVTVVERELLAERLTEAAGRPLIPAFLLPGGSDGPAFVMAIAPEDGSVLAARIELASHEVVAGPAPLDRPVGPARMLVDGRILLDGVDGPVAVLDGELASDAMPIDGSDGLFTFVHDPVSGDVALGAEDGRVAVFDLSTSSIRPLSPVPGAVGFAAFSPDGSTLAVMVTGVGVQLIDVASGELLGVPMGGESVDFSLQPTLRWSDDGRSLWFIAGGDLIRLEADPEEWPAMACAVVGRQLTADEWRRFVSDEDAPVPSCG